MLLVFSGCVSIPVTKEDSSANEQTVEDDSNAGELNYSNESILEIEFSIPKTKLKTRELISGEYSFKNVSKEYYFVMICEKEGFSAKEFCVSGTIYPKVTSTNEIQAFEISETSHSFRGLLPFFISAGNYSLELQVFEAEEINRLTNNQEFISNLSSSEKKEILTKLKPVKTVKKTITVTGETIDECSLDEDCIQECENCESGKYSCYSNARVCIECFLIFDCKEGFECREMKCVEE